jgi:hypothetical protein
MSMTGGPDGAGGDGWHTGSLNPGTGGDRDTYNPSTGSAWSQAEYAEMTEKEAREGRKPILVRLWLAVRRTVWGE